MNGWPWMRTAAFGVALLLMGGCSEPEPGEVSGSEGMEETGPTGDTPSDAIPEGISDTPLQGDAFDRAEGTDIQEITSGEETPDGVEPDSEEENDSGFERTEPDTSTSIPTCTPSVTTFNPGMNASSVIAVAGEAGSPCWIEITLESARVLSVVGAEEMVLLMGDEEETEPGWIAPHALPEGEHLLTLTFLENFEGAIQVVDYGDVPVELDREKSLVWTDPILLSQVDACDLECLLTMIATDGQGGALLNQWFTRFATTAHSERLGPLQLLASTFPDSTIPPEEWDLSQLPFAITGIHNRLDLKSEEDCGELRISVASTDPVFKPLHFDFVFAQPPSAGDISPGGILHCTETAMKWAALSGLEELEFAEELKALLEQRMVSENFRLAESVEFVVAPWEWRQWFLEPGDEADSPSGFDNRPLVQTVDIERLNQPGPDRDAFLEWVEENAAGLSDRTAEIPEMFRPLSARLNQGVPWIPLNLEGLASEVQEAYPELRQEMEIMGCPGCHSADAEFVQTLPDGTFSPFYDVELDARLSRLMEQVTGSVEPAPFGPLQVKPVVHP